MNSAVLYATHGDGSATITLNRPERLNAIDRNLIGGFADALEAAAADPSLRVVLLRSEGRAFCAGDDLTELVTTPPDGEEARFWNGRLQDITRRMMFSDFHVVALVRGWTVGGGVGWPLNADFALWADDAKLFLPEAGYGLFVSGAVSYLLADRCGPERARELMLMGEKIGIETLLREGIAKRSVPLADLETEGRKLVDQLLEIPHQTLISYKRAQVLQIREQVERALAFELEANVTGVGAAELLGRLPSEFKPSA